MLPLKGHYHVEGLIEKWPTQHGFQNQAMGGDVLTLCTKTVAFSLFIIKNVNSVSLLFCLV